MPDATGRVTTRDRRTRLQRLDAGNARFVSGALEHPRRDHEHRAALSVGQRPYAAVLGCSDSRVPHEILFDEGLGDLFAVRVAGNTAHEPIVLGSIEFAVAVLGVSADRGARPRGLWRGEGRARRRPRRRSPTRRPHGRRRAHRAGRRSGPRDHAARHPRRRAPRRVRARQRHATPSTASPRSTCSPPRVAAGELALAGREYRLATGEAVEVT